MARFPLTVSHFGHPKWVVWNRDDLTTKSYDLVIKYGANHFGGKKGPLLRGKTSPFGPGHDAALWAQMVTPSSLTVPLIGHQIGLCEFVMIW